MIARFIYTIKTFEEEEFAGVIKKKVVYYYVIARNSLEQKTTSCARLINLALNGSLIFFKKKVDL